MTTGSKQPNADTTPRTRRARAIPVPMPQRHAQAYLGLLQRSMKEAAATLGTGNQLRGARQNQSRAGRRSLAKPAA